VLSHKQIKTAIDAGEISIDPFTPELLKRNSYVLRLGGQFRRLRSDEVLDIADGDCMRRNAGEAFEAADVVVDSTSLLLASSFERISLAPDLVGVLSGITNIARLGTLVHATSAFVNAGYGWGHPGRVVFELATIGGLRVRLYRGLPVCHLAIFRLKEATVYPEASARTGQDAPGHSELFAQFGKYIV
jgi:dCTP deaminase